MQIFAFIVGNVNELVMTCTSVFVVMPSFCFTRFRIQSSCKCCCLFFPLFLQPFNLSFVSISSVVQFSDTKSFYANLSACWFVYTVLISLSDRAFRNYSADDDVDVN